MAGRGWVRASVLGAGVFALIAIVGEGFAFLQNAASPSSLSTPTIGRIGLLYFYAFHHVGIVFDVPRTAIGPEAPPELALSYRVSVALLTVTILAILLLVLAGRSVANRWGGGAVTRAVLGMKVALPYGVLSVGLSYLAGFEFHPPGTDVLPNALRVFPWHVAAFFWPFFIALLAGGAGGLSTAWGALADREPWGRRAAGALRGGWRMFAFGLAFSLVGLLVLAGLKPEATRTYFRGTTGRGLAGADALAHHILALPNQSMWVLVPAMGSCDGFYVAGTSIDFLCYWRFPKNPGLPVTTGTASATARLGEGPATTQIEETTTLPGFGTAPAGYFLFLLVPLAAVLLGGSSAVTRGRATTAREAAAVGAGAGVVFALLVLAGTVLGGIGVSASAGLTGGIQGSGRGTVGPNILTGTGMALLWGVLGGASAGLFAVRRGDQGVKPEPPGGGGGGTA